VPGRALHDLTRRLSLACPGPQLHVGELWQSRAPRMSVQGLHEYPAKVPGQGARSSCQARRVRAAGGRAWVRRSWQALRVAFTVGEETCARAPRTD